SSSSSSSSSDGSSDPGLPPLRVSIGDALGLGMPSPVSPRRAILARKLERKLANAMATTASAAGGSSSNAKGGSSATEAKDDKSQRTPSSKGKPGKSHTRQRSWQAPPMTASGTRNSSSSSSSSSSSGRRPLTSHARVPGRTARPATFRPSVGALFLP